MKNIISLLQLAPGATEEQIVAALNTRLSQHAEAVAEIARLRALAKQGGLPRAITPELLEQKLAAGLPKGVAIDVLLAQVEHDRTKPHDPVPGSAERI